MIKRRGRRFFWKRTRKVQRPRGTNWQPGGDDRLKDDEDRYAVHREGPQGFGKEANPEQ